MGGNLFRKLTKGTNHFFKKVGDGANSVFQKAGSGLAQAGGVITKGLDKAGNILEKNSGYLEDIAGGLSMATGNEALGAGLIAGGQATIDAQKMMKRKVNNTVSRGNSLLQHGQARTNTALMSTRGALQNSINSGQNVASTGLSFA